MPSWRRENWGVGEVELGRKAETVLPRSGGAEVYSYPEKRFVGTAGVELESYGPE